MLPCLGSKFALRDSVIYYAPAMKRKVLILLSLCLFFVYGFGGVIHQCIGCEGKQDTGCHFQAPKQTVAKSCHGNIEDTQETISCSSHNPNTQEKCDSCVETDVDESIVSTKHQNNTNKTDLNLMPILLDRIVVSAKPDSAKSSQLSRMRASPSISSSAFLKTIRLLC